MSTNLSLFGPAPPAPPTALHRGWLLKHAEAFAWLRQRLQWDHHTFGHAGVMMPRLECFMGPGGSSYSYSGSRYPAKPLDQGSAVIMARVNEELGTDYNACFANLYRTGADSIGWHADDDHVLGRPSLVTIASVSLGARRRFKMRHRDTRSVEGWDLGEGDMLYMGPGSQSEWSHAVPKTTKPVGERLVLTFRQLM